MYCFRIEPGYHIWSYLEVLFKISKEHPIPQANCFINFLTLNFISVFFPQCVFWSFCPDFSCEDYLKRETWTAFGFQALIVAKYVYGWSTP